MLRTFESAFPQWKYPLNVIDFGCGQCCEYRQHGIHSGYLGLDLNPPSHHDCYACDYKRVPDKVITEKAGFPIHAFVSLFSTECCMDKWDKFSFYRRIFNVFPIQVALVSGFYYENKIKEEQVKETGGIYSYQSIEDPRDFICSEFIELRTHLRVPSKMFGDDVVEVWKLLIRKPDYVN